MIDVKHIIFTIVISSFVPSFMAAQVKDSSAVKFPELTNEYLDTVQIKKSRVINNYSMIGVTYGVTMSKMIFTPAETDKMKVDPFYLSVLYTRYEKMFGYLPYFGFQTGIAFGREGFRFEPESDTGSCTAIDGATEATYKVIELPFLAQIHFDTNFVKFMIDIGCYGGYRTSVHRIGPTIKPEEARVFRSTDIRFDYGLQGGAGIGVVLAPVEIHLGALLRYSWSSIYTPDPGPNKYKLRYAYPFDIMITAGVHFHLTKRYGKTSRMLKNEAREEVYIKNNEN